MSDFKVIDGSSEWLTPTEYARERGISRWTVYRAIDEGRLYAFRAGRHRLLIRRDDADRFTASCRVKPRQITKRGGRLPKRDDGSTMELARVLTLREARR